MWIDTHCHLDDDAFAADVEQAITQASQAGVEAMLTQGTTFATSRKCLELAERFPTVFAAVSVHPNCLLADFTRTASPEEFLDRFQTLATHPQTCAIGETGLDAYWDDVPLDFQKIWLEHHLTLARLTRLPVVIHCRDAELPLLETLRHDFTRNGPVPGVIHSFSGDVAFLRECIELGFYISYSGSVTYTNKKFDALRETVPQVPADKLLVETDSPYLIPMPFRGKLEKNQPALVAHTGTFLAKLRDVPVSQLAAQTTANARRLFFGGTEPGKTADYFPERV
ncbi:MAG: TatD family hydrolase [Planctomycetia bacterium]|nr:TatD family hydrolase [Planctomycetia bacterium]